jgi:hypothetical protein
MRIGLALAACVLQAAALAHAHVRLIHSGNGVPLYWNNPHAISIVIHAAGSDDVQDESCAPALRNALAAWNAVPGSRARLIEDLNPNSQANPNWASDSLHALQFDESNSSGYFPPGSGIVAITPVWFQGSGRITDADVLFNGLGYSFTTERTPGHFDVQDVAVHELGHLLGFDHTGCAGASLYPYVDPQILLHRSVALDDATGLREVYPDADGLLLGGLSGDVRRASNGDRVAGALVVARDALGRNRASTVCDELGRFELGGLEPGDYRVYARPLDEPVSSANLSPGWDIETDFGLGFAPGLVEVSSAATAAVGTILVSDDVALSLGKNSNDFPLRVIAGQHVLLSLGGTGLALGSTLASSDSTLTVPAVAWMGSQVNFRIVVPAGTEPGHVDLSVTNSAGHTCVLPGAIEITPPDPQVLAVNPPLGSISGGTQLSVQGSGFRAGLRVVLGANIYAEGVPGGVVLVSPNELQLVTSATSEGVHDLVVIDETGVEGRASLAFEATSLPVLESVFPPTGSAAGGTELVLRGSGFVPGSLVRIDGVAQSQLVYDGPTRMLLTTEPGVAGGPYLLEVENPSGALATLAFSYAAAADPLVQDVDPAQGSAQGGEPVTVFGSNFDANAQVVFGADPDTGTGGVAAQSVLVLDSNTLQVVTPQGSAGWTSVLVSHPNGQASLLSGAFAYASQGGGGGGGGCSVREHSAGGGPGDATAGLAPLALLALHFARRALEARRPARAGARAGRW